MNDIVLHQFRHAHIGSLTSDGNAVSISRAEGAEGVGVGEGVVAAPSIGDGLRGCHKQVVWV